MDVRSVSLSEPEEASVCASLQVCISRFENDTSPVTLRFNQLMGIERERERENIYRLRKNKLL